MINDERKHKKFCSLIWSCFIFNFFSSSFNTVSPIYGFVVTCFNDLLLLIFSTHWMLVFERINIWILCLSPDHWKKVSIYFSLDTKFFNDIFYIFCQNFFPLPQSILIRCLILQILMWSLKHANKTFKESLKLPYLIFEI